MSQLLVAQRALTVPGWAKDALWRRAQAIPSLDLRFADSKSLVDATTGSNLVTFTRASSGTFVGSDGVIRTAVTNLLLQSEDFSLVWAVVRASISTNQLVAPNGTTTADKLMEDSTASNSHFVQQAFTSSSGTYTFLAYLKAGERTQATVGLSDGATALVGGVANLSAGTISTFTGGSWTNVSSSLTPAGDGWYRCRVTATQGAGASVLARINIAVNNDTIYTGNGTSGIYLWGAQLEQSSSVGKYIPTASTINSAPRFDHNPTTGESLGLLVEEQRTNSIRNNTMVGAVAGTPGTLPTNWAEGLAGLTRDVVGIGTTNGITWIDLRFSGTSTSTVVAVALEGVTTATASAGQNWTNSFWIARVGGSTTNVTGVNARIRSYSSTPSFLGQQDGSAITLTSSLVRHDTTYSNLPATTAFVEPVVRMVVANSAAIDITLRIGLPQLEQGAFATSVIPTTTATVTRSADVCSIGSSAFSSWYRQDEGTVFTEFGPMTNGQSISANFGIASISSGSFNNGLHLFAGGATPVFNVRDTSVDQAYLAGTNPIQQTTANKVAANYSANSFARSIRGLTPDTDESGTVPSGLNQLTIGRLPNVVGQLNGTIRRLTYWNQRLANSTLQSITQ